MSAIRTQETPFVHALRAAGATHIVSGSAIPYVSATVSAAQRAALAANPAVKAVFPNQTIHLGPPLSTKQLDAMQAPAVNHAASRSTGHATIHGTNPFSICGTAGSPEQDPEALSVINASNPSYNGAGVNVAYIAGHINTTINDFQRNPNYVGPGSPSGAVVSEQNFNGDPAGYDGGDLEAFLDASSIAAQGNTVYDLSQFVNAAHPLPSGCDMTITGDAPGSTVTGLNVFSSAFSTTTSNFVQAIDWAVGNNINVLNESFGGNPFPDTAQDAIRMADDYAVSEGVTVVVSSGDAGITSTDGSPSTDPNLISAGASTTFRSYQQYTSGGINATTPNATNGTWIDNNISSISSGGYSQSGGNTVNLVAPGDLNWIACDTATCGPVGIAQEGGTSESSPLTAGAAADVISAYRATHGGDSPSPAEVKNILVSTASDISAPAEQQGAGLLNVGAAINLATTIDGGSQPSSNNTLTFSTNQINITQNASQISNQTVGITNNGTVPVQVNLSSRALSSKPVSSSTGQACLNPTSGTISCGPPTPNTFLRETGSTQVYVEQTFNVPSTGQAGPRRLSFTAALPAQETNFSILKVALYSPSGAYAGYSIPQGTANYANIQVANPQTGTWTAVLFDTRNNNAEQGTVTWEADTYTFGPGGKVSPSSMTIPAGQTAYANYKVQSPPDPGDTSQSIVVSSAPQLIAGHFNGGPATVNTIPVTIRTMVKTGLAFHGTLTGGNGRGNPSVTNTYAFNVPGGLHDIDAGITFPDDNNYVIAYLIDPQGNAVASSSSITLDGFPPSNAISTNSVNVYVDHPQKGQWTLVLNWLQPVSGDSITMPFSGRVDFNKVKQSSNLPTGQKLSRGNDHIFYVSVTNTSASPEAYFLDPRTSSVGWFDLPNQTGSETNMSMPGAFTTWEVPTDTYQLNSSVTGTAPVTYDQSPWYGDPDLYGANGGNNPSIQYSPGGEVAPGLWDSVPSEVGPYGNGGADTSVTVTADAQAYMQEFDPTVSTESGDLWLAWEGLNDYFYPAYLQPGETAEIGVDIVPSASVGTKVKGYINLDTAYQFNVFFPFDNTFGGADELASIPYSYKVSPGS